MLVIEIKGNYKQFFCSTIIPMKIYLTDQKNKFKQHLDYLKKKKVMNYNTSKITEKITTTVIKTSMPIDQLNLDVLFNYEIFPKNIMTSTKQWSDERRAMKIGDTIVQQVYLPPTKIFSQKLIFGVRINKIIDESDKKGFSYETLEGHVEKGISTFTIEQTGTDLIFKVHTYSTPGTILSKLVAPFFSIPYQTFCTKAAIKNVKRRLEEQ